MSETKALILVGGYGTRLRPLTLTMPKPLVPFVNKSILLRQIEALRLAGVHEFILAVSYRADKLEAEMNKYMEANPGIKIHFSLETEPLGTAGPIGLAKPLLKDTKNLFVLNSDVICNYPFPALLKFHCQHGGEGTIVTTKVEDPTKYGVVVADAETGLIERFVEKPKIFVGDQINAGIYVISSDFINRCEAKPTSIEREIFPAVASDKKLYSFKLTGIWADVGQPPDYMLATKAYLQFLNETEGGGGETDATASPGGDKTKKKKKGGGGAKKNASAASTNTAGDHLTHATSSASSIKGNVLIDATVKIGQNCLIGDNVVIGADCVIGDGVRLNNTTLLSGCKVANFAMIKDSLIGWNCEVGSWARVTDCVFGEQVVIANELKIESCKILPFKGIKEDSVDKIVM